jgi:hypothetical protein
MSRSAAGWRCGPTGSPTRRRGSSTTPGSRSTVSVRPGWRGCTAGRWGKTGNCQIGVSVHAGTNWGLRCGQLAPVPAGVLGRHGCGQRRGSRGHVHSRRADSRTSGPGRDRRAGTTPGDVAPGAGHARPAHRVGTAHPAGGGRRRLRRCHRVPPRPDRPRPALRPGGHPDRHRPPWRRRAGHPDLPRHRTTAAAALSRQARGPARPGQRSDDGSPPKLSSEA